MMKLYIVELGSTHPSIRRQSEICHQALPPTTATEHMFQVIRNRHMFQMTCKGHDSSIDRKVRGEAKRHEHPTGYMQPVEHKSRAKNTKQQKHTREREWYLRSCRRRGQGNSEFRVGRYVDPVPDFRVGPRRSGSISGRFIDIFPIKIIRIGIRSA